LTAPDRRVRQTATRRRDGQPDGTPVLTGGCETDHKGNQFRILDTVAGNFLLLHTPTAPRGTASSPPGERKWHVNRTKRLLVGGVITAGLALGVAPPAYAEDYEVEQAPAGGPC